ncbi:MAG: replication protein DnaC, partial [Solirubrobacteraceae bacterium]|nr:replication protein DnaC [Solirubrobacteraceae bacterium]
MTDCPYSECDGSGFVVDTERRTTKACRCRPARIAERKKNLVLRHIPQKFREVSFDRHPVPLIDTHVVAAVRLPATADRRAQGAPPQLGHPAQVPRR